MTIKYRKSRYIILLLGIVFLVIYGICNTMKDIPKNEQSSKSKKSEIQRPNTMKPAIMLDESLYYTTGHKFDKRNIDFNSVSYVKSVVTGTKYPENNGEINFPCENAAYIRVADGVVIKIDDDWILFKKDESLN